ncbi:acyltransferase [Mucilaginibacter glaciei]|uniref:Acyltransferase n=1 Tax=Mucilaginibacter glaciei TaxID=2772109 RepID=A0A926NWK6_9SPHI|nr:acyltransferase [Mucilaginibacter glaciei]MBD1395400.1 acyltransferase [Mucilaginibacter glaciei]
MQFHADFVGYGVPILDVSLNGKFSIGKKFRFNSGKYFVMAGRPQQCYFTVGAGAEMTIGENVGITSVTLFCKQKITIGNNVKIGINTVIYDTDFHSLDAAYRNSYPERLDGVRAKPVVIMDGAFIGGHSTILKGVTIGRNSIVAAGSVVFNDIPDEQIWGGNPASFIKENYYSTVLA